MKYLWSNSSDPLIPADETNELKNFVRGHAQAEGKYVSATIPLAFCLAKTLEVVGIVQFAIAIKPHVTTAQGVEAVKARALWSDRVNSPVDMQETPVFSNTRQDATVNDWDQVGVRQDVENVARPWPINTAHDCVAVQDT